MKIRVLILADDKTLVSPLVREMEKFSCVVLFHTGKSVTQSVFHDVPHLILIDEEYDSDKGKRIAVQFKEDILLKFIPIILLVRDMKSILSKDRQRIDAIVKKDKDIKTLAKLVRDTCRLKFHELDFNPLTHLPGIRTTVVKIEREIAARRKFSVLCIDLTHLSPFNSAYGDARGDEVIIRLSEILKKAIRLYGGNRDFLGHLGGDNFMVLTTPEKAAQIAESLIQSFDLEAPGFYDREDRERGYIVQRSSQGALKQYPIVTLCIAIAENEITRLKNMAEVTRAASDLTRAMQSLPGSCYARAHTIKAGTDPDQKEGPLEIHFPGKMKSVIASNGSVREVEEFARYFHAILKEKKIKTLYQPLIDLKDRRIIGYEALTRPVIHYPSSEASTLFSVARQINQVKNLDRLCIECALKNAQTLSPEHKLFLNLNHETLVDPRMMRGLFEDKGSIGFKNIVIEVTEQSILRSFDRIREALTELKEQGVAVAIDDVGGGAVSLRDVAALKPDYIKFDRLLVRQVDLSTTKQQIFLSLILFARGIGSLTVAEGIETREECETIRMCGVDLLQGYFFARPGEAFPNAENLSI